MELLATLLVVAIIVMLVGGAFYASGIRGPWSGGLWFFLVLFLTTLAIGTWARPMGPRIWDVPWLTFLIAAVFVALLIAAATPNYGYRHQSPRELPLDRTPPHDSGSRDTDSGSLPDADTGSDGVTAAATAVGVFLWIFVVVAGTILILGVLYASAT